MMLFEYIFHGRKYMRVSKSLFSFIGYKPSSSRRMWFEGTFVRRGRGALVLTTGVWLDWSLTAGDSNNRADRRFTKPLARVKIYMA